MAIEINDSNIKISDGREYYIGLCDMRITAVNPTQAQLKSMGFKQDEAPKYTGVSDTGEPYTMLRFYAESDKDANGLADIKTSFTLYLRPEHWLNKAGDKYQFIDKFGKTGWCPEGGVSNLSWIDHKSARKAYRGEETLVSFMRALANVGPNGLCGVDDPEELAGGDFAEIQEFIDAAKNNEIKLLLGVSVDEESGKVYPRVYTRYFGRKMASAYGFQDALRQDYGEFKAIYPKDLSLQLYDGQGMSIEPDKEEETASGSLFS